MGGSLERSDRELVQFYSFKRGLADNQRRARLLGGEIDAAIDDPRCMA